MKNSLEILNNLYQNELKKVNVYKQINDFIDLLGYKFKSLISRASIKGDCLNIFAKNSSAKQELSYESNILLIKNILRFYKEGDLSKIKNIKIFYIMPKILKQENINNEEIIFIQKSRGCFINKAEDGQLKNEFENLREILILNLKKYN